eukprot:scaffold582_cov385-Prasinococcus_capsulatus_cf.AAC.16
MQTLPEDSQNKILDTIYVLNVMLDVEKPFTIIVNDPSGTRAAAPPVRMWHTYYRCSFLGSCACSGQHGHTGVCEGPTPLYVLAAAQHTCNRHPHVVLLARRNARGPASASVAHAVDGAPRATRHLRAAASGARTESTGGAVRVGPRAARSQACPASRQAHAHVRLPAACCSWGRSEPELAPPNSSHGPAGPDQPSKSTSAESPLNL